MYKHIKLIKISNKLIEFETNTTSGRIHTTTPLDFCSKRYEEKIVYKCDFDVTVTINRSFLTITKSDQCLLRFYIPKPVRYYIQKDIQTKDHFDLEYRKHLRSEYDNSKHVLVSLNGVDLESDSFFKISKRVEQYSRGIHSQPILVVFYDGLEDVIRYSIVHNNIVVESGYEPMVEKGGNLPNIFDMEDEQL